MVAQILVSLSEPFVYELPGRIIGNPAELGSPPDPITVKVGDDEVQDILNKLYTSGKLDDMIAEIHMEGN